MTKDYRYLLDRIRTAEFELDPFPHLYLCDFLNHDDFAEVSKAEEVQLEVATGVERLFSLLEEAGYQPIQFPGCTESKSAYLKALKSSTRIRRTHSACEGKGMALRLHGPKNETVRSLADFFSSPELHELLKEKFGITRRTIFEGGLHKYLHGYEISPHPDIRKKALTWMLNVNPAYESDSLNIHTHYLKMKPERAFITELWKHNPTLETCWVPWDWCTTAKRQVENNSIVFFSPRWDTIHAVKADYDHLSTQRTQFYGNLWFESDEPQLLAHVPEFGDLDFTGTFQRRKSHSISGRLALATKIADRHAKRLRRK